jgi:hypothetical protein
LIISYIATAGFCSELLSARLPSFSSSYVVNVSSG